MRGLKILGLSLLAGGLMLGTAQASQHERGFYIAGGAGAGWANDMNLRSRTGVNAQTDFDMGWLGGVSAGYSFANGLRTELEYSYRTNDIDALNGGGAGGDAAVHAGMANAFYDIDVNSFVTPYVGLGVGYGRVDFDGARNAANTVRINDADGDWALQGIVGAAWTLSDNLRLTTDYRYFMVNDITVNSNLASGHEDDYRHHGIMVGLRYSFGAPVKPPMPEAEPVAEAPAPTPAAPAAPLPAPALVFFDFDSSSLTAEAQQTIRMAADAARQGQVVRIQLTGYADRSGGDAYNIALSQRRADAVKGELERLGVNGGEIATIAKGENDPLVPTADGVREPQNRRVVIEMQ